jgi:hypothetical protein
MYRSFNDDQPMYLGGALFLDNPIRHSIRSPARKELVFFLKTSSVQDACSVYVPNDSDPFYCLSAVFYMTCIDKHRLISDIS